MHPAHSQELDDREPGRFSPLELLEPDVVRRNGVKVVTVAISDATSHDSDESGSCLVESFEFDNKGNLVLHSPPLVGSDYFFAYQGNNELVDFGRVDKEGHSYSLPNHMDEAVDLTDLYKAERVPENAEIVRSISNTCFNIDAEYRFRPEYGENGLPSSALLHKIRELDSGMFSKGDSSSRSPKQLRTVFTYVTLNEP